MSEYVLTDTGPFAIVPLWLVKAVSPNALATYALLAAKWADRESNSCFPSRKTIAAELDKSIQTVDRSLKELEDAGAIEITRRIGESGDYTSNIYRLFTVRQGVAANLRVGGLKSEGTPKSEGRGSPKSEGRGSPTDEELTRISLNQNQLEPYPTSSSLPSALKDASNETEPPTIEDGFQLGLMKSPGVSPPSPMDTGASGGAAITPGQNGGSTVRPGSTGRTLMGEQVRQVYEAWVEIMGKNAGAKLNDKRRSKIEARLREQYSVEELIAAIKGARANPWMMGKNDRGTPFTDITTILRDGSTTEGHRDYVPVEQTKAISPMEKLRQREKELQAAS